MEYDSDRAGGFEPLRFVPKGKTVVLGLVTSKSGTLGIARTSSSAASTRRRNSSPLDQLCLSPQCGFASTEEGNILAEDEQWAKLRMIVDRGELGMSVSEAWALTRSQTDATAAHEVSTMQTSRPSAPTMSAACCAPPR